MRTDLLLVPFDAEYDNLRDAALAAEAAGFDGLWTWDHLSGAVHRRGAVLECWTVLSALAEAVPRLALGPLVLNAANREPGVLAAMASTLQQVSGGRLLLGLGAGGGRDTPYALEQHMLGRPVPPDPVRRELVAETAEALRRLWSGDERDLDGTQVTLRAPRALLRPDPPPPIVVGAFGPHMAEVAGRCGDGINTPAASPDLAALLATARDAHAATGRDPTGFLTTVFAGLSDRWLRPHTPHRDRLKALGVDRLILSVDPPFDPAEITTAGRLLHRA